MNVFGDAYAKQEESIKDLKRHSKIELTNIENQKNGLNSLELLAFT